MAKLLVFALSLAIFATVKTARLGESCVGDADCQSDLPGLHSQCLDGKGTCGCKWAEDVTKSSCLSPPEKIGDYCELERDCHVNLGRLARCPEHECTCTEGTSPNEDGTRCIPNKKVGDRCVSYEECPDGDGYGGCIVANRLSEFQKTCVCHEGSVPNQDKTRCVPTTQF